MQLKGTTICAVRRDGRVAIAGDGQVTMGESTIFKSTATKVRRIYQNRVAIGFAGSVADAITLSELFEEKLVETNGNLERAAVRLARDWRGDKALRKLEALLIASDGTDLLIISGNGEIINPDDGICAIGSGGNYALAAARALLQNTDLSAHDIAEKALHIAASICVYTNDHITVEDIAP
ncbi:MAG: ATP-dependent protease subunit HslV [Christensenellales bacterium]|jgi:ATP-dependent HslUV protease subunit HslV